MMQPRIPLTASLIVGFCLTCGTLAYTQTRTPEQPTPQSVRGTFEVKLVPQDDKSDDPLLGRMTIDKQFHGDLEATGKGQMLVAATATKGSAGYVAIEKVSGTLQGRKGTFVLQHNGIMTREDPNLSIRVVPDSATGELVGLTGRMSIRMEGDKHFYEFVYILPPKP